MTKNWAWQLLEGALEAAASRAHRVVRVTVSRTVPTRSWSTARPSLICVTVRKGAVKELFSGDPSDRGRASGGGRGGDPDGRVRRLWARTRHPSPGRRYSAPPSS